MSNEYPDHIRAVKRVTGRWEMEQRACASLGFYGSTGSFVSWAGKPLYGKDWAVERPYLHESVRFKARTPGLSWPLYQSNKSVMNEYEKSVRLGQEVKVLKKKLKTAETWTPVNVRSINVNEVKTISKGTLYVMESMLNEDIYKVGSTYSGRVYKRLSELQTSTPMRCIYMVDIDCDISVKEFEKAVHKELEAYNLMNEADLEPFVGRELFRCSPIIVLDAIKNVADATGVEI